MNCTDNTTYIPGQRKITPTGTIEITENGTYDVSQYANADVNVSGGGGDDSFAKLIDGSITVVNVPEGVAEIRQGAFYYLGASTIILPSTTKRIEKFAIASNTNLTSLVVKATTPPTVANGGISLYDSKTPIYVPAESVNAYKSANRWSSYATNIQPIPQE